MKVVGNGVGGKILCENLTVSPKYVSPKTSAAEIRSQSVPDLNINIIGAGAVQTSKRVYKVVIGL